MLMEINNYIYSVVFGDIDNDGDDELVYFYLISDYIDVNNIVVIDIGLFEIFLFMFIVDGIEEIVLGNVDDDF